MYDKEANIHSIKALIVFKENNQADNLFVPILCDAIRFAGIDARYSLDEFWDSEVAYDIIHFQWPEEVVGRTCDDPLIIQRLKERIAYFRSRGAKFVYTRHNTCPHDSNEIIQQAYDVIESQSDVIVHMGHYSLETFAAKHPDSRNVLIPHHLYEYTYKEDISTERARQYLKLPQEAFIIGAFGAFGNLDEITTIIKAFRSWDEERKLLIAPQIYPFSDKQSYNGNLFKRWGSRLGYHVLMPLFNRLLKIDGGAFDEKLDSCDLPYYIAASDVILIPQKNKLNSPYLLLAFLFHKVVTGSSYGDIGELLRETGNPDFDPDNQGDILRAFNKARQLRVWFKGEANHQYAKEHLGVGKIGKEYAQLYNNTVNA